MAQRSTRAAAPCRTPSLERGPGQDANADGRDPLGVSRIRARRAWPSARCASSSTRAERRRASSNAEPFAERARERSQSAGSSREAAHVGVLGGHPAHDEGHGRPRLRPGGLAQSFDDGFLPESSGRHWRYRARAPACRGGSGTAPPSSPGRSWRAPGGCCAASSSSCARAPPAGSCRNPSETMVTMVGSPCSSARRASATSVRRSRSRPTRSPPGRPRCQSARASSGRTGRGRRGW